MAIKLANMTMVYAGIQLFGEFQQISLTNISTSVDTCPTPTLVNGVPVSCIVEYQSLQGGVLPVRMTTAQVNAIVTPINSLGLFDSTLGLEKMYQNGGWHSKVGVASGTLTNANLAGMYAAPVNILPAPPAGYMYVVTNFVMNALNATAAFGGGGNIAIQYGNAANGVGPLATAAVAAAILSTDAANRVASTTGILTQTLSANLIDGTLNHAGLFISNIGAAFTVGGGATGTATWRLMYTIIPIA